MNLREIIQALKQLIQLMEWDSEVINEFHAYAQKYGGKPGGNVYRFVLDDALRLRREPERADG